jgi:hypothetical protein
MDTHLAAVSQQSEKELALFRGPFIPPSSREESSAFPE